MLQDTPQDAPLHVMLGHTLTLEEAQNFLPPLPPWALVSRTQDHRTHRVQAALGTRAEL